MDVEVETIPETKQITAALVRAVFDSEMNGRMRPLGDLRLSVLEWILDLNGDPGVAARSVLSHRPESHAAALPEAVIAILHEIADTDVARVPRRGRRAGRRALS